MGRHDISDQVRVRLMEEGKSTPWEGLVPVVRRHEGEWKMRLSPEAFQVGRSAGTEPAFCGVFHCHHAEGIYFCAGCGLPLFSSSEKFESGTGWPSFVQPFAEENLSGAQDLSHGMTRTEISCMRCQMHLGHQFADGPPPSGQRYCINSVVLGFQPAQQQPLETLVLGAGCFWGVEAKLGKLHGVACTEVGYAGGHTKNPRYEQVCGHTTGHAEVVRVQYRPKELPTADLLRTFFALHDPTTVDRQGPDVGDQYRSVIFFTAPGQEGTARRVLFEVEKSRHDPVATQIDLAPPFYRAEEHHQQYLAKPGGSCGI